MLFSREMDLTMTEPAGTISQDGLAELQQKFSEIKRSINNAPAVMMALSEMSQRQPDYAGKLATTVTIVSTDAPQIV